jgi:hypothetical protein
MFSLALLLLFAPPQGAGLAAKYPGDRGLSADPAVVFAEDFEQGDLATIGQRWGDANNKAGQALFLDSAVLPGGPGRRSLRAVATRGANEGGHLYKVLKPGYDKLCLRFYVRFAEDFGWSHHFVTLGGKLNAPRWPEGDAGLRPTVGFTSGIEPQQANYHTYPAKPFNPPGIWHFYTYWPEMRSYQTPEGKGDRCYGNDFEPKESVVVPRGKWVCVEMMIQLNSTPDASDGEQAFWIDGKLAAWFAPGSVKGYWMRDVFRLDDAKGQPFEGLRWRTDPRVTINKVWLMHYVSERVFAETEAWAKAHPGFPVNSRQATVWFDDIVVSREYVGPRAPERQP